MVEDLSASSAASAQSSAVERLQAQSSIALVEPRAFHRECLAELLARAFPECGIEAHGRIEDLSAGRRSVVLLSVDHVGDEALPAVEAQVRDLRTRCAGSPLALIVNDFAAEAPRGLGSLGIAGLIEPRLGASAAVAAIKLMIAGGYCLPPGGDNSPPPKPNERAPKSTPAPSPAAQDAPPRLTSRECDIMRILRAGGQNKLIAYKLGISESTVKVHLRHLMLKLNATNRTQLALGAPQID